MNDIDTAYIEQKFVEYCKVNTRSDPNNNCVPTTKGQVELLMIVKNELQEIGLKNISYSAKDSYLVGLLPSNTATLTTAVGFVAHVDTADYNAENVQPQIYRNYDGEKIYLDPQKDRVLDPAEFPSLKKHIGETLITASGSTLLGADDKAGIAGLLGMLKYFKNHPNAEHGDIWVAFGPDEEIGQGAKRFDISRFPVEFAYTLDNGDPGDIAYETFNAASATLQFKGTIVHPGEAYGLMVNATTMASEFIESLPKDQVPEKSKDFEGFMMVLSNSGDVGYAKVELIIRDFDTASFLAKKKMLIDSVDAFNKKYGENRVEISMHDQYKSPGDLIKQYPYVVNLVLHAYEKMGLVPKIIPFRGGTDGDFISEKGIPTPNLFNGGANFHGPYEYVSVESMSLLSKTLITIVQLHLKMCDHRDNTPLKRKY